MRWTCPACSRRWHRFNGYERVFAARSSSQDYRLLWSDVLAGGCVRAVSQWRVVEFRELAALLRDEVLSRGNEREPMESFEAFRGRRAGGGCLVGGAGVSVRSWI